MKRKKYNYRVSVSMNLNNFGTFPQFNFLATNLHLVFENNIWRVVFFNCLLLILGQVRLYWLLGCPEFHLFSGQIRLYWLLGCPE